MKILSGTEGQSVGTSIHVPRVLGSQGSAEQSRKPEHFQGIKMLF